jgi:hypothetical protein
MLSNNNNNSVDAWKAVERWLHKVDRSSPINLKFITSPLNETITNRIRSLEAIYQRSKMYRFLVQKGVNPFFLFSSVTAGLSFGMFRAYTRSTRLSLTLLGVVYPTLECWKIIQDTNEDQQQLKELKGWLTYWLIFGSFRGETHRDRKKEK